MANGLGIPKLQVVLSARLREPERLLTLRSNRDTEDEDMNRKTVPRASPHGNCSTPQATIVQGATNAIPAGTAMVRMKKKMIKELGGCSFAIVAQVECRSPWCTFQAARKVSFQPISRGDRLTFRTAPKQKFGRRVGDKSFNPILLHVVSWALLLLMPSLPFHRRCLECHGVANENDRNV
jgi:hypothetical protein